MQLNKAGKRKKKGVGGNCFQNISEGRENEGKSKGEILDTCARVLANRARVNFLVCQRCIRREKNKWSKKDSKRRGAKLNEKKNEESEQYKAKKIVKQEERNDLKETIKRKRNLKATSRQDIKQGMGPDNKKRVHGTRGATKASNANKSEADEQEESEQTNQSRNMKIKTSGETVINKDGKKTSQMKNKSNIRSQQGTGSSSLQQQQQSGQKRKQGLTGTNMKQSFKEEQQIDEVEEDIENIDNQNDVNHREQYISHNNHNNINSLQSQQSKANHQNSQQAKDISHNTFQSPQSLLEESKENTSECNSAQTKLRRSARNTTESKCLSSNKTTPILISPTKNARTNKRTHTDDQSQDELEPALRKQIQKSFMENSQKIEEPESDNDHQSIQANQYQNRNVLDSLCNPNIGQIEIEDENLNFSKKDSKGRNSRQSYRQPLNKRADLKNQIIMDSSNNNHKNNNNNQDETKEDHMVTFSQDRDQIYQNIMEAPHNNYERIYKSQADYTQEGESDYHLRNIRLQRINFEYSESEDTGDSNSQNIKKSNKSRTLTFQRLSKKNNAASIKDELDGQSQSFQSGSLLIQVCQTDEHYPPLFNQQYLDDNFNLIQKKQCHIRQKRRFLQLNSINSISVDKNNFIYNLLDMKVIREREEGNLKDLDGIVEYEQTLRPQTTSKQKVKCNCKKSKCLKLYCDCFNQGQICNSECNCIECCNTDSNKAERESAIKQLQERNPDAFKPKIQTKEIKDDEEILIHNKGCNCKKSGCEKKYCECYNTGVKCSDQCKCDGCRNRDPSEIVKINNAQNNNASNANSSFSNQYSGNNKQVDQYLNNEEIYQHNSQSMLHHNSNLIGNSLLRQSQEDSIPNYSQSMKRFNMGEYNPNIPARLGSLGIDSQNMFNSQNKFYFSQDDNMPLRFSQNSQNNINPLKNYQGIVGYPSQQYRGGIFDDNSQKSENQVFELQLTDGQVKNIITKKE